jgi:DNA-binding winged helix-turn-helix (wHTH) protein
MDKNSCGFQFSHFELNCAHKTLHINHSKTKVDIGLRLFKLLELLCAASPEAINKQELIETLWPESVVSEHSLARLISDARHILGDNGDSQHIIKTYRGIGFCIPDVTPLFNQIDTLNPKPHRSMPFINTNAALFLSAVVLIIGLLTGYQYYQQQRLSSAITRIALYQDNTYTAFIAQVNRRNELVEMVEQRLGIKRKQQYEKFFALYSEKFTQQEAFVCEQIRAITNAGLLNNNQAIVDELTATPEIFNVIPQSKKLQQHLIFWLNKYQSIFISRKDMCLLYVGVEDGVPYPSGVDKEVKAWLLKN